MDITRALEAVAMGEASPQETRALLAAAFVQPTSQVVGQVYGALRAWAWKALNDRRRDPELREWLDVLQLAGAFLEGEHPGYAHRLAAISELVHESVRVSEILSESALMENRHVREVIAMLDGTPWQPADRVESFGLPGATRANQARVLSLLVATGLAERAGSGDQARYGLTLTGREFAARVRRRGQPQPETHTTEQTGISISLT